MSCRVAYRALLGIAAVLGLFSPAPAAQLVAARSAKDPIDLVIVVDVSYSMFYFKDTRTDPGGIRWDAIQFLIDTAAPDDRVALILYRADAALVSRHLAPADSRSGFVTLGNGPDSPRVKLKEMIAGFQKFEEDIPRGD